MTRYLDRAVADMLLCDFHRRLQAAVAQCEAATLRQTVATLRRQFACSLAVAADESERRYLGAAVQ
jgi:hypothetical protein